MAGESSEVRGERPARPLGGLPVSELAILGGGVAVVVALLTGARAGLIVGFVLCALAVMEVTGREHFSGYRSHSALLAAIPAVGLELLRLQVLGSGGRHRDILWAAVVPLYVVLFWLLRRRFLSARQARADAAPPG